MEKSSQLPLNNYTGSQAFGQFVLSKRFSALGTAYKLTHKTESPATWGFSKDKTGIFIF
jgi:hypothetical protein